jgi:hypothetical protein
MNDSVSEALRSILLFVESTRNLDDPMLEEIRNDHETLIHLP